MATAQPLSPKVTLPPVPAKRYFTIGEVSELCDVKQHVLRYWEQEFTQLRPMKRRGNRRYYQHHEVMLIRRIRALLYEEGFTISGARGRLDLPRLKDADHEGLDFAPDEFDSAIGTDPSAIPAAQIQARINAQHMRNELLAIRALL
jgi:DNA-binding transcriptional MerR regulator